MTHDFDIVVAAPNAAIDSYYVLPELALNQVNRAAQTLHTAGGKGNNMARAATMLGGRVLSLGIVGGSSGQFIVDELAREGIAAEVVWMPRETRRSATMPVPAAHQTTVVLEDGVPAGEEARETFTALVLRRAAQAPFVTLIGSLPPDFPPDYYAGLIAALKARGARVALDCSGATLKSAVSAAPSIVKINAAEFSAAFGVDAGSWDAAAQMRADFGLDALIVTDGRRGAAVFAADRAPFAVSTAVESWLDATGAGDTFMAGLLLALNRGESIENAARYASAAAAASLQQVGAGFLDRRDVERFLTVTQVKALRRGVHE